MSGTIKAQVQDAMKAAMRSQDKERLGTIRLILSEFKQVEVDERIELDEVRELAILDKMQKQRKDAMAQYQAAGREELVAKEQFEWDVIQTFKPQALSDEEVASFVKEAIESTSAASMQDMGKVMAILKPKLQGRADMTMVSAKIKALLSAR